MFGGWVVGGGGGGGFGLEVGGVVVALDCMIGLWFGWIGDGCGM